MDRRYLVIKLPDDAIEREQTKQNIKMLVGDNNVLNDENIITCRIVEAIPKHFFVEDVEKYVKEKFAMSIGKYLFENELIRFDRREDVDDIKIGATITILK